MRRPTNDPGPRRDREVIGQALAGALVTLFVFVLLWVFAPNLEATAFWSHHFPWVHPQEPLPIAGVFLVAAALSTALWPGTWEGELLSRSLRGIGWATLLYWLLAVTLEAPAAAGLAVLPLLASPAFAAFGRARAGPSNAVRPWLAVLASLVGAAGIVLLAILPLSPVLRVLLVPAPVALYVVGPPAILRAERAAHQTRLAKERPTADRPRTGPSFYLDLPPGTLRPPTSGLGVIASIAAASFIVLVVAPGVPLSGPIAWIGLTLSLPAIAWGVLRRAGVAHPRRLIAPPWVHVHTVYVTRLRDQELERLDDAIARFVRTGRGRTDLATAIVAVLAGSGTAARHDEVDDLLARLPRGPWRRRDREAALAHILGGTELLHAHKAGGRTT